MLNLNKHTKKLNLNLNQHSSFKNRSHVCISLCTTVVHNTAHHTITTTVLQPFFRDHPGQPVPEENFWTLWCKGRLTDADTLTIRLSATPFRLTSATSTIPPIFTGRMPFLPPNQQCQSTKGNTAQNSSDNFLSYREAVCHEEDTVLVLTENADELIHHIMSSTCLLVHPFNWTSGAENTLLGRTVLM